MGESVDLESRMAGPFAAARCTARPQLNDHTCSTDEPYPKYLFSSISLCCSLNRRTCTPFQLLDGSEIRFDSCITRERVGESGSIRNGSAEQSTTSISSEAGLPLSVTPVDQEWISRNDESQCLAAGVQQLESIRVARACILAMIVNRDSSQ